ncbi:protein kinase domain-containing protein [Glacieibacterium megasporae]|uniref:protein kinase domain-containing protein n=1 Tax=Glacieibacterium megasporae TaxID=2835787 RepID=UPI001C1E802D|nr:protein kinase [Polymorphobacter megasporae]UAJ11306.1 protein kinase [Polymorphobacter megasporae]
MLEIVGRYRIEGRIGEGAMADVYRAFDPQIARPLAVKLLKAEFLRDRQYADRFLREAKAAGALSHPNIVTIYDVGEADGTPYIVMELLEGRPLDQVLQDGALDPITTLRIGIQLADALAFAHSQRVVHRDIKPSNIIVAPDGHSVKLLDFGIARVGDMLFEAESVRTQAGQVLGTPRYMSPEQALGGAIDGRSDLFSVGTVLYEMLSGRRAFQGGSSATLAIQIVQGDPDALATIAPSTPGGLQFIVSKLLSKQPGMRFADGRQLAEAMRKELAALTAVGAEAGARHAYLPIQVRLPVMLAVITALLLGAAIWTVLTRQYAAMENVALASGDAISSFVASNAALRAVENATLPGAQQDWLAVEAFVRSASDDPTIRRIVVVGADGIVHASSDAAMAGKPYSAPHSGEVISRREGLTVLSQDVAGGPGVFRFVRPITYAGRSFGQVDVEVSKASLEAAARLAQVLLAFLGLTTVGGVALTSYFGARALAVPLRRTKAALLEVAGGNLDFRISHTRRDEFGELFDSFNLAANALQERIESVEHLALDTPVSAPAATVSPPAAIAPAVAVAAVAPTSPEPEELPIEPAVTPVEAISPEPAEPHAAPEALVEEIVPPLPESAPIAEPAPPPAPEPEPEPQPESTADDASLWDEAADRTQIGLAPNAKPTTTVVKAPEPPSSPDFDDDDDDNQDTLIGPARR